MNSRKCLQIPNQDFSEKAKKMHAYEDLGIYIQNYVCLYIYRERVREREALYILYIQYHKVGQRDMQFKIINTYAHTQ